jgi:hypothetical protein
VNSSCLNNCSFFISPNLYNNTNENSFVYIYLLIASTGQKEFCSIPVQSVEAVLLEKYHVRCARGIFTFFAFLMMVLIWRIEHSFCLTCVESKNYAGDYVELFDGNEGGVAETQQPLIEVNAHGIVDETSSAQSAPEDSTSEDSNNTTIKILSHLQMVIKTIGGRGSC